MLGEIYDAYEVLCWRCGKRSLVHTFDAVINGWEWRWECSDCERRNRIAREEEEAE